MNAKQEKQPALAGIGSNGGTLFNVSGLKTCSFYLRFFDLIRGPDGIV
jgi:hypothetical protein